MKNTLWILIFLFCSSSYAEDVAFSPMLLPGLVKLEGLDGIYGAVGGAKNVFAKDLNIVGVKSWGAVVAQGLLISDIPLYFDQLKVSLVWAQVDWAKFKTSYTRGFENDNPFQERINGNFQGGVVDLHLFERKLKISAGWFRSKIIFDQYYTTSGDIVYNKGIGPVLAAHKFGQVVFKPSPIINFKSSALTFEDRHAQTPMVVLNNSISSEIALLSKLTLNSRLQFSDSVLLGPPEYTDYSTVLNIVDGGACAALPDAAQIPNCQNLTQSLARYIVASNSNGTASPIGGSSGLRGYREFQFKSAHTRIVSAELRYNVLNYSNWSLQLSPFFDFGYSSDEWQKIYNAVKNSYGLGVRYIAGQVPVRLEIARGEENTVGYLTIGYPW